MIGSVAVSDVCVFSQPLCGAHPDLHVCVRNLFILSILINEYYRVFFLINVYTYSITAVAKHLTPPHSARNSSNIHIQ